MIVFKVCIQTKVSQLIIKRVLINQGAILIANNKHKSHLNIHSAIIIRFHYCKYLIIMRFATYYQVTSS